MNEYDYDDETLEAEEQYTREVDLPAVVRNWEKTAISYSRHNNIPSIIGFYSILGDLVKGSLKFLMVKQPPILVFIMFGFKLLGQERQHW